MTVDRVAFEKLRRIAPGVLAASRHDQPTVPAPTRPLPDEIAFKLTNRCDLRCNHCYQWGADGYHHDLTGTERTDDLSIEVVQKVLAATAANRSNVYLWGGEPLLYRHWNELMGILEADARWTSICTNGTLLQRRLPSLQPISANVELVVSIDGFESAHDELRGSGSFRRTIEGVRHVIMARRNGEFEGELTINFVISDSMVGKIFEFVSWLENEDVDTVFVSLPWFLSPEAAAAMDRYVTTNMPWTTLTDTSGMPTWHSYSFALDASKLEDLRGDLGRVQDHSWKTKVRFNPRLDDDELDAFIRGSGTPAQDRTRCASIGSRLDVFPDGRVVSCKFFPESVVGDLNRSDLAALWHGARFRKVRETIARCGLMPGCAKCPLLYSRGG